MLSCLPVRAMQAATQRRPWLEQVQRWPAAQWVLVERAAPVGLRV